MRIFLVVSDPPTPKGEAVEVVSHEVMQGVRRMGHAPILQVICRYARESESARRMEGLLQDLRREGYEVQPMLYVQDAKNEKPRKFFRMFDEEQLFRASCLGPELEARVVSVRVDVLLGIWSWEALAASYRIRSVPKMMYYGNPDHLPAEARLRHPEIFGGAASLKERLALPLAHMQNRRRKALHVRMMNRCEMAVNNSIRDTQFYSDQGHPDSRYLQNLWPAARNGSSAESAGRSRSETVKLIGSIGNLGATGNSFGLYYLAKELLPRLRERFGSRPFEIHLLGKGTPTPPVARLLDDPRIIRRGWVEDVEAEMRSAHAFLVLTNVSPDFLVGNTRILLAWALRTCVIMHENSVLAMPEIRHGENALLGKTPEELADWIVKVSEDAEFRRRIEQGGYETFQTYYRSDIVVPKMVALLEELVSTFKTRKGIHAQAA